MATYLAVGTTWRSIRQPYVMANYTWRELQYKYAAVSTTWREVYKKAPPPPPVIGDMIHGGMYLGETASYHVIMAVSGDYDSTADFNTAKMMCNSLDLNGFYDWELPLLTEVRQMSTYLQVLNANGAKLTETMYYWTDTRSGTNAYVVKLSDGTEMVHVPVRQNLYRAIRRIYK